MFRLWCLCLRNGTAPSVLIQAIIEGHSDAGVVLGPPDRTRRRLILEDHLGGLLDAEALDVRADRARGFSGSAGHGARGRTATSGAGWIAW
jgi:hypothetical protein